MGAQCTLQFIVLFSHQQHISFFLPHHIFLSFPLQRCFCSWHSGLRDGGLQMPSWQSCQHSSRGACMCLRACLFWGGEPFTLSTPSRVGVWGVVFREESFFFPPFHTPLFSPSFVGFISFFSPTQCMGRSHCLFLGFISVYQPSFYYVTRKQQYSYLT